MLETDPNLEKGVMSHQSLEKMLIPFKSYKTRKFISYKTKKRRQALFKVLFISFYLKKLLSVSNVLNYSVLNKY